ncbi:MAG: hypothetical protein NTZ74_15330 [Chloroflexi bacterium]|nr:hypothetical protein [Chloroflexota bacterium]
MGDSLPITWYGTMAGLTTSLRRLTMTEGWFDLVRCRLQELFLARKIDR